MCCSRVHGEMCFNPCHCSVRRCFGSQQMSVLAFLHNFLSIECDPFSRRVFCDARARLNKTRRAEHIIKRCALSLPSKVEPLQPLRRIMPAIVVFRFVRLRTQAHRRVHIMKIVLAFSDMNAPFYSLSFQSDWLQSDRMIERSCIPNGCRSLLSPIRSPNNAHFPAFAICAAHRLIYLHKRLPIDSATNQRKNHKS